MSLGFLRNNLLYELHQLAISFFYEFSQVCNLIR